MIRILCSWTQIMQLLHRIHLMQDYLWWIWRCLLRWHIVVVHRWYCAVLMHQRFEHVRVCGTCLMYTCQLLIECRKWWFDTHILWKELSCSLAYQGLLICGNLFIVAWEGIWVELYVKFIWYPILPPSTLLLQIKFFRMSHLELARWRQWRPRWLHDSILTRYLYLTSFNPLFDWGIF